MLEPIDLQRIHRIFDAPRPDLVQQLRDNLNQRAAVREQLKDGLFYSTLGVIAAVTFAVLIMWVQS